MTYSFTGYTFRCTLPDGRSIRERRGGELDRRGRLILSTPELDEAMRDGVYFLLGATELQPHDANRHPIGKPFADPHKRASVTMPPPKQVAHDDLVCGATGYLAFDVIPARHSSELSIHGAWVPATLVCSPDEVLLSDGTALPATTSAIAVRPERVPEGNFILSKSGQAWTRGPDGPRSLGVCLGQVEPLARLALEGGTVAVREGDGWRVVTLA